MTQQRPFSFLRLGDMELQLLIASQKGGGEGWWHNIAQRETVSSVLAFGHPGLQPGYVRRLQAAYENCTYLDFQQSNPTNNKLLKDWVHRRSSCALCNPVPSVSELLFEWIQHEFRGYVEGRRCMFVGAEALLLKNLLEDPSYRDVSRYYWPTNFQAHFYETGDIGNDLDQLKDRIREVIDARDIDTVFLSLGGGAKILAYELALEAGIACFDFGSIMRGLTYSGSDGHKFMRASHYPFFYRVPFRVWMNALKKTMPNLSNRQLLIKAHAQLAMEVIRKEEGWTYPSEWVSQECIDLSDENLKAFRESYRAYKAEYIPMGQSDADAVEEIREFARWRRFQGIGLDGKIARFIFQCKVRGAEMMASFGQEKL